MSSLCIKINCQLSILRVSGWLLKYCDLMWGKMISLKGSYHRWSRIAILSGVV
ncbi:unnamed protein product, partial [Amoebophrya sp. A25]|eukprot:GSA25T00009621001.1